MKVMIPSTSQDKAMSISLFIVLVKARISEFNDCFIMFLIALLSPSETTGNPASI